LYIDDVVEAFDVILHRAHVGEVYNIGSPFEISNYELAKRLLSKFGIKKEEESKYIFNVEDRAFNDCRYHIDASKLHRLGWHPRIDFEEGLDRTSKL
jgi:dTDP-D-glucose 4,6-dehydratase